MENRAIDQLLKNDQTVWVFTPRDGSFPCGVWGSRLVAEAWINEVSAAGTLSAYILDESAYDSNVRLGLLNLDDERRRSPTFIKSFTTAVDHHHYGPAGFKG